MQCGPANQNFGWAMAHLAHAAALPPPCRGYTFFCSPSSNFVYYKFCWWCWWYVWVWQALHKTRTISMSIKYLNSANTTMPSRMGPWINTVRHVWLSCKPFIQGHFWCHHCIPWPRKCGFWYTICYTCDTSEQLYYALCWWRSAILNFMAVKRTSIYM